MGAEHAKLGEMKTLFPDTSGGNLGKRGQRERLVGCAERCLCGVQVPVWLTVRMTDGESV